MSIGKVNSPVDRSVRIAAAASVLLGGILVAMLFRHHGSPPGQPGPENGDRLVLRRQMEAPMGDEDPSGQGAGRGSGAGLTASPAGAEGSPKVLRPISSSAPPPELAREYPGAAPGAADDWPCGSPGQAPHAPPEAALARMHKVVDGDTLAALAERYLGSADRGREIYEANRGVLPGPGILPIGVELKIPPRQGAAPSPSNYMPRRPLVPVSGER